MKHANQENQTMKIETRPRTGKTTYHRDGTVTIWDCVQQSWVRGNNPSDALLATLDNEERERMIKHTTQAK
jgi:Zn-finger protein